jgi:hypothetical protein
MSDDRSNSESAAEAPQALKDALVGLRSGHVFVPPAVDDAVLSAARRHFARRPQSTRQGRVLRFAWAAAAVLVLGVMLSRVVFGPGPAREQLITRAQFEHGAAVDILNAFALARRLEAGVVPADYDLNADGVVDRRDVDVLAARAVRLAGGGGE